MDYDTPCAPECLEPVRAVLLWCLFSSWFLCPLTGSSLPAPFFYQLRQDPGSFVHSGTQHIRVRGRRCEQLGSDTWDRRGACWATLSSGGTRRRRGRPVLTRTPSALCLQVTYLSFHLLLLFNFVIAQDVECHDGVHRISWVQLQPMWKLNRRNATVEEPQRNPACDLAFLFQMQVCNFVIYVYFP